MNDRYQIDGIRGRRVWDSRGRPTIEAEVTTAGGVVGRAIAPAGASRGSREAHDLRDGGAALGGLDVTTAIANVTDHISPVLRGHDVRDQQAIDLAMIALDGTEHRTRIGANAMVAVSMASAHTAAVAAGTALWRVLADSTKTTITLPLPEIQIFGGGAHAARRVDIQDFMIMCPGADSVTRSLYWTAEVYRAAGQLMEEAGKVAGVADEGGYWPLFDSNEEALEYLVRSIERTGHRPGEDIVMSLDVAASEFGSGGRYRLARDGLELDTDEMIEMLERWVDRYPICSIEDPLGEDDGEGFVRFTRKLGGNLQIVGDDLLVTDADLVRSAAHNNACNAVLLKPNQRGTLSETLDCWQTAQLFGYGGIISARSGETEDVTICHLAVGWGIPQIKVGSFARSERMAKWNELIRIEESLGDRALFAGRAPLSRAARPVPMHQTDLA